MTFLDLDLKQVYDSDEDNVLSDFYIPVLSESVKYKRLTGSFSSSALSVAAKGISRLIRNGGTMQLITGVELHGNDVEAIRNGLKKREEVIADIMIKDVESIEHEFIKDHVKALAWMIANGKLEIKVAVVEDEASDDKAAHLGIFHSKIGIMEDSAGNVITFGGSINESMRGWLYNDERFYVFRAWIDSLRQTAEEDSKKFDKCWNGLLNKFTVVDIPTAFKQHLIKIAPTSVNESKLEEQYNMVNPQSEHISLRDYQKNAVDSWLENDGRGLFEMATGTGKTYTAIACMKEMMNKNDHLATVISVPYTHLVGQWKGNLKKWDYNAIEIFGEIPDWKRKLGNEVTDLNEGFSKRLVVITTHDTFSNPKFIDIIQHITKPVLLIADEVHAVGSEIRRQGLIDNYGYRLGLSATPSRYFDEEGTLELLSYFGETVAKFDLEDGIEKGFLVPYEYYPHYVELLPEEFKKYREYSKRIAIAWSKAKDDPGKKEQEHLLEIQRQRIVVNAQSKIDEFNEILGTLGDKLHHCLIYCSEKQIGQIQDILYQQSVVHQKVTFQEDISEREKYLQGFDRGVYKAIVAMKCLDEGIDIPSTHMAIILASTGNPKQYIQRRGRILRPHQGKEKAIIYDILVVPTIHGEISDDVFKLERKIVEKELKRHEEMAGIALNKNEALEKITLIKTKYSIS